MVTSRFPHSLAALTSLPMYISIRCVHRLCNLSRTVYVPERPSIFTLTSWVNPIGIRPRDTAITFIPGTSLSPHAVIVGSPWVWSGRELYAVAVTLRTCLLSPDPQADRRRNKIDKMSPEAQRIFRKDANFISPWMNNSHARSNRIKFLFHVAIIEKPIH